MVFPIISNYLDRVKGLENCNCVTDVHGLYSEDMYKMRARNCVLDWCVIELNSLLKVFYAFKLNVDNTFFLFVDFYSLHEVFNFWTVR